MRLLMYPSCASSAADKKLCAAFRRGEPLDFKTTLPTGNSRDGAAHDSDTVIHACLIRHLLLSKRPSKSGPLGQLSISGATIRGPLDLRFAEIEYPVQLTNCTFDSPVMLSGARLRTVSLSGSVGRRIDARHVTVTGDLNLDAVSLRGPLRLTGAHLEEDLHLAGAHIMMRSRRLALNLADVRIKGNLEAAGLTVRGKVTMNGAHIDGSVRMARAQIHARPGTDACDGDGMKVAGELDGSKLWATGKVRLIDARVLTLALQGVHIENSEVALLLDRLESSGSVFLSDESQFYGGVSMIGIQVRSSLYFDHATVKAWRKSTDAVIMARATITGDLHCPGIKTVGNFDLTGARIGGQVWLSGAKLQAAHSDENTKAFTADRAEIRGDLFSQADGFFSKADGFACVGTMSLVRTQVSGVLELSHSEEGLQSGSELVAPGLRVACNVTVFTAGTINLSGAEISGDADIDLADLHASSGDQAVADLSGVKTNVLTLHSSPINGVVDLTNASVRLLLDKPSSWSKDDSHIVLDGFEYDAIAALDGAENRFSRRSWLEKGSQRVRRAGGEYKDVKFTPRPYQQLAMVYKHAGQDREHRDILYAMYHNHNRDMVPWRRFDRLWNYAQDGLLGYGYIPWRAVVSLVVLASATTVWFSVFDKPTHIGIIPAAILSLGLALPGSGYDKIEKFQEISTASHVLAAILVLSGLLLGAVVIAAVARVVKQ